MTDEQTLIIEHLKRHEGETAEDVLNVLSADPTDHRVTLANALQYLIWNGYIKQDVQTNALTLRESAE